MHCSHHLFLPPPFFQNKINRDVYGVNVLRHEYEKKKQNAAARLVSHSDLGFGYARLSGVISPTMQRAIREKLSEEKSAAQTQAAKVTYEPQQLQQQQQQQQQQHGVGRSHHDKHTFNINDNDDDDDDDDDDEGGIAQEGRGSADRDDWCGSGSTTPSRAAADDGEEEEEEGIPREVYEMYHTTLWNELPRHAVPTGVRKCIGKESRLARLSAVQLRLLSVLVGAVAQCSETQNL